MPTTAQTYAVNAIAKKQSEIVKVWQLVMPAELEWGDLQLTTSRHSQRTSTITV